MPAWGPVSRRTLIATLRKLGFDGPYSGGKHEALARRFKVSTLVVLRRLHDAGRLGREEAIAALHSSE